MFQGDWLNINVWISSYGYQVTNTYVKSYQVMSCTAVMLSYVGLRFGIISCFPRPDVYVVTIIRSPQLLFFIIAFNLFVNGKNKIVYQTHIVLTYWMNLLALAEDAVGSR
jgi:hypothetical protein